MAGELLICGRCRKGYASAGERPPICPACDLDPADWTSFNYRDPKLPYKLTRDDRLFLRVQAIRPD